MAGQDKSVIDNKVKAAAATLNLTDYLHRKPRELSGGQRQRVAIGRAIVREPKGFLFDEPLSNLDAALRVNMRLELSELHQQLKTTMIYVTHDQVEAMTMADKIVVLQPRQCRAGRLARSSSTSGRRNLFVAGFIGSPKMNFLTGPYAEKYKAKTVGIRPEHLQISTESGDLRGIAGVSEHLGSDTFIHIKMDNGDQVTARGLGDYRVRHGDPCLADAGKPVACTVSISPAFLFRPDDDDPPSADAPIGAPAGATHTHSGVRIHERQAVLRDPFCGGRDCGRAVL